MSESGEPQEGRLDPTRVRNQPALRTSSGRIWLIMGALFAVASLIPFGFLAFGGSGRSSGPAILAGVLILSLYTAIVVSRFAIRGGPTRLRFMAVCLLTMAAVALVGIWVCMALERAPA